MIQKLTDDLQNAIRSSLPAQVADTLRQHLQELESDRKSLHNLQEAIENARIKMQGLEKHNADLITRVKTGDELEKMEREIEMRERALDVTLAVKSAAEAEKRAEGIMELARIVFRNKTLITSLNGMSPVIRGNDQCTTQEPFSKSIQVSEE